MLLQQFAERLAAIGVFVGIELRHFQRRWRRRIIEDMPQCPGAAIDHPVVAHPREHGLDARLAQQTATTRIITAQLGLAQIGVGKPFIAVMPREAVVHHRPITIDQLARRTVVFEHLRDVGDGFLLHRFLEVPSKAEVLMLQRGHGQRNRLPHHQPLPDKRPHKRVAAWINQQPVHLCIEHLGIAEFALLGQPPQGGIRWRAGEHEAQARSNGVLRFGGRTEITKRRTHQHRVKRRPQGGIESCALLTHLAVQREERLAFAAAHRPTPGPLHPQGQQPFGARIVIRKLAHIRTPFHRGPQCEVIHLHFDRLQGDKRRRCFLGRRFLFAIPQRPIQSRATGDFLVLWRPILIFETLHAVRHFHHRLQQHVHSAPAQRQVVHLNMIHQLLRFVWRGVNLRCIQQPPTGFHPQMRARQILEFTLEGGHQQSHAQHAFAVCRRPQGKGIAVA